MALGLGWLPALGWTQSSDTPVGKQLTILQDDRIKESSGIVGSRNHPNCYWTHNDSGDGPYLFLVDTLGRTRARVHVAGAEAIDWEDIAMLHDPDDDWLIVADIGNARPRKSLMLYGVREPVLNSKANAGLAQQEFEAEVDFKMQVTIPGGPTNYESLAVDPVGRKILLIEKAFLGGRMYEIAIPSDLASQKDIQVQAVSVGKVPVPIATACDVSEDGRQLVVISYQVGFLFQRQFISPNSLESWNAAIAREPLSFSLGRLKQTEAVCFLPDGLRVLVTSEMIPTPVVEITLPLAKTE
jgi:hypothetical protein